MELQEAQEDCGKGFQQKRSRRITGGEAQDQIQVSDPEQRPLSPPAGLTATGTSGHLGQPLKVIFMAKVEEDPHIRSLQAPPLYPYLD